ncbi:MAG TPA: ABC transporter substrate-binding protein [Pseudolabrys sp.]|nr:ABC transporter substrate-binding protein [Pseudolabrys sp.]
MKTGGSVKRRKFLALLAGAAATWPVSSRAQQLPKLTTVGVLASQLLPPVRRLTPRLQELGYTEGQNLRIEYRFAEGHDNRYPSLAAELAALPVDLIVTSGTPAALAAKRATSTIPIVMATIGEAVSTGVVSNLARPGGNITGFTALNLELEGKRLALLKELLPHLSRVGILANRANPLFDVSLRNLRPAANALGLTLDIFNVRDKDDIESALLRIDHAHPDGVVVAADTLLLSKRGEIAASLAKGRFPAIYAFREYADVGGLMIYGANLGILFERTADYVDKIIRGAKPGELPVQQATEFELTINLKAAAELGLKISPSLIARADEVIE